MGRPVLRSLAAQRRRRQGRRVQAPDANGAPGRLRIYKGHFEDHVDFDRERHDRDWREKRKLTEATFGWAITAHKAQGSQWENVIVWDDGLGKSELDSRRWLYTAITRAEQGLVIPLLQYVQPIIARKSVKIVPQANGMLLPQSMTPA